MFKRIPFPTSRQAQNAVDWFLDLRDFKARDVSRARVCLDTIYLNPLLIWSDGKALSLRRSGRATGPAWQARRFDVSWIRDGGQNPTVIDAKLGEVSEYIV